MLLLTWAFTEHDYKLFTKTLVLPTLSGVSSGSMKRQIVNAN